MSNYFGSNIKINIFGQSHSPCIGCTIEGLPAGFKPDMDKLHAFMSRRAPGKSAISTSRVEKDMPEFISGLVNGRTCGAPLTAIIHNTNTRSGDYSNLKDMPRPSHADYTANVKFGGYNDIAGGGQFSGRLTAPLCLAGGLIIELLEREGIKIYSHISAVGDVKDSLYNPLGPFRDVSERELPVLDIAVMEKMKRTILNMREQGDSIGGVIECATTGLPAGVGDPMFDGLENTIARTVFAIPAVRGIEFGAGFLAAGMRGSEHNDEFIIKDGKIATATNNHGGILGGISSGMPLIFRVAIKPTASISKEQNSVSLSSMSEGKLTITGRHDPCIVHRAVPCVEAAGAIAIYDRLLANV